MRIAIVNWSCRKVGGAEIYLDRIIPRLHQPGHPLAFLCEMDGPADRERITLPEGMPLWRVSDKGDKPALEALRQWHPDSIYSHGLLNPKLEAETLKIAPAVFFAHNYYGTCISGAKTFKFPVIRPCHRRFGWPCLLHYYPRRCGGLNPMTMWKDYRRQSQRLTLLKKYRVILVASTHMRNEYLKHGIPPDQIRLSPLPPFCDQDGNLSKDQNRIRRRTERSSWRLLFLGRMDFLKGEKIFIKALPQIQKSLDRSVHATFAGDGPTRSELEYQASRLQASERLKIDFVGWVNEAQRKALLAETDLLVMPSLWPEPFGMVGPEAGLHGVPAVAFRVGGITDWLIDGVNGHLASSDPPTAEGLSQAVIKCLHDSATYDRLCRGARELAQRFSVRNHLTALQKIFEETVWQ